MWSPKKYPPWNKQFAPENWKGAPWKRRFLLESTILGAKMLVSGSVIGNSMTPEISDCISEKKTCPYGDFKMPKMMEPPTQGAIVTTRMTWTIFWLGDPNINLHFCTVNGWGVYPTLWCFYYVLWCSRILVVSPPKRVKHHQDCQQTSQRFYLPASNSSVLILKLLGLVAFKKT